MVSIVTVRECVFYVEILKTIEFALLGRHNDIDMAKLLKNLVIQ